jgi:tetratricopeptide (TPR) repeat protein
MVVNEEAEALKAEGNELVGRKEYAKAAKKYKKAISVDPTRAAYWSNLALCYDKMKDLNAFKEAAQKCVEADPTFVKGYKRLASAQEKLWEYEQAKATLEKGLAIDSGDSELRKVLQRLKAILEEDRRLIKETLKVPSTTTNLPFLGGLGPEDKCRIPPGTAYARFKRTPLPPVCKKQKDMLPTHSSKIRPVFEAFYNGDLHIEWLLSGLGENQVCQINGYVSASDTAPVISSITSLAKVASPYGSGVVRTVYHTDQHQFYQRTLTIDQKEMLLWILLHRFFRAKMATIQHRNFDFAFLIIENTIQYYNRLGMYKDSADLKLIIADTSLNRKTPTSTIQVVHFVEALEASKRFEIAAQIYDEISDATAFPRHIECPETLTRGFAALAYKRAQKYVEAEREYVASFRAAGPNWTWDSDNVILQDNLENMMIFYDIVHNAVNIGLRTDAAHRKMQQSCHLMVGLLSIAGFSSRGCTLFAEKDLYQELLKPEFRSREKAKQAIVNATMATSIDEYHKLLFSYQIGTSFYYNYIEPSLKKGLRADLIKEQKINSKKTARELQPADGIEARNFVFCTNCGTSSQDMKQCPCGVVTYCSKECQVAHWKQIHKTICTARKSR